MCLQYAYRLVCGGVAMKVGDIVSFSKGNPGRKGDGFYALADLMAGVVGVFKKLG